MEPEIGQWDKHRMIGSIPQASKGETLFVFDIETWGLDATALAFGCFHNVNTGEEWTFYTKEAMREFIESQAPCIVYGHNSSRYDTLALYTVEELYNARKIANGTRIFELEPRYFISKDGSEVSGGDGEWVNQRIDSKAVDKAVEIYKPITYAVDRSKSFTDSDVHFETPKNKYWGGGAPEDQEGLRNRTVND